MDKPVLPAKEVVDKLRELYEFIKSMAAQSTGDEMRYHQQFLDLYHDLERAGRFDGPTGYRYAKSMQETLLNRRRAKWNVSSFTVLAEFVKRTEPQLREVARQIDYQEKKCGEWLAPPSQAAD